MLISPIECTRLNLNSHLGLKASVSTYERIDDRCMPPSVKAGPNYLNSRYAQLEVSANGYDVPIILDRFGKVSESSGACLMLVRDNNLVTPPHTSSILHSITQDTVMKLASSLDLVPDVRVVDRSELYSADELFICGSAVEITPIRSVDRFKLDNRRKSLYKTTS